MSIEWIPVDRSVPDDKRDVLAWGVTKYCGVVMTRPNLLGVTHYIALGGLNRSPRFALERGGNYAFGTPVVTHWAEIEGPTP